MAYIVSVYFVSKLKLTLIDLSNLSIWSELIKFKFSLIYITLQNWAQLGSMGYLFKQITLNY